MISYPAYFLFGCPSEPIGMIHGIPEGSQEAWLTLAPKAFAILYIRQGGEIATHAVESISGTRSGPWKVGRRISPPEKHKHGSPMKVQHEITIRLEIPQDAQAATKQDLQQTKEAIMAKQADITAALNETAARVTKLGTETRTLLDKIEKLQAAVDNLDNASPELEAAAKSLADQVAIVDELVPDAVPA